MKRILTLLALLLVTPLCLRAQDAATEEQLNRLRADLTALQAANVNLQKNLDDVRKELQELREQMAKPTGNYAAAEDVKRVADAVKEVDRKREADRDLILDELKKLAKAGGERRAAPRVEDAGSGGGAGRTIGPEKGYEYVIQSGDTLSAVVTEYRKQGVKVTVDDVIKANPGLKPASLKVGQKVFIPAP